MLRINKVLMGIEDTVIIFISMWVNKSPCDYLEGGEDKSMEGALKVIDGEPWLVS